MEEGAEEQGVLTEVFRERDAVDTKLKKRLRQAGFRHSRPITPQQLRANHALLVAVWKRGRQEKSENGHPRGGINEGLRALGYSYQGRVRAPEQLIRETLDTVYSRDLIQQAQRGEIELPTPKEFRKQYGQVYDLLSHAKRPEGRKSFREEIELRHKELFTESIFPDLYSFIARATPYPAYDKTELRERVGKILRTRFNEGLPVDPSLRHGTVEERGVYNAVMHLAALPYRRKSQAHHAASRTKKGSYVSTVATLLGVDPTYVNLRSPKGTNLIGALGEHFVYTVLQWGKVLDADGKFYGERFDQYFPTPLAIVDRSKTGTRMTRVREDYSIDLNYTYADIHVSDGKRHHAVEVKTSTKPHSHDIREIKRKYPNGSTRLRRIFLPNPKARLEELATAAEVEGATVVIHAQTPVVNAMTKQLTPKSFEVLPPETFRRYIEHLVTHLDHRPYALAIAEHAPGLYDPTYLLRLYDDLTKRPHVLRRPSNEATLKWSIDLLKKLERAAISLSEEKPADITTLELKSKKLAHSKKEIPKSPPPYPTHYSIAHTPYGPYFHVHYPIDEIEAPKLHHTLTHADSSVVFNPIKLVGRGSRLVDQELTLGDVVVLDFETASTKSFSRDQTLAFLTGIAAYDPKQGLIIDSYFARNPGEERAVMSKLRERLDTAKLVVTYNGGPYDIPVARHRLLANVFPLGIPPHLDVLPVLRAQCNGDLPGVRLTLKNIGELFYGHTRTDDIPGSRIAKAYHNFVKNPYDTTNMTRTIRHNAEDTAVTAAVLVDAIFGNLKRRAKDQTVKYS